MNEAEVPKTSVIATNAVVTSYFPFIFTDGGKVLRVHYDGGFTIDGAHVEDYEVVGFIRNLAINMTKEAVATNPLIAALVESLKLKPKGSIL